MEEHARAGPQARLRRGLGAVRVVHPFPSLLVTGLTVALVPLAGGSPGAGRYLALGGAMLCFQFAIGLVNDVADAPSDAVNKPWKPIPAGIVRRDAAVGAAVALIAAGVLVSMSLPFAAWLIGLAGLGCGLAYDLWLKRTVLSWLPYAMALPLLPAWVFVAAGAWDRFLGWVFPLGMVLGLALHLANQAPDETADARAGITSAVQLLGERHSRAIATALFGVAASLAVIVVGHEERSRAAVAGLLAAAVLALAPWSSRWFGRDGLFGLLAVGSAGLAVVFLSVA